MRSTAILNLKGGVGKTTTAIHLALMLRQHQGARVLLIDCDPQCNLTQFFEADAYNGNTAGVLLAGSEFYAIGAIQHTKFEGVDIIPADDRLMELDLKALNQDKTVKYYVFRQLVLELGQRGSYDYVLFDCPPAFNAASAACLLAADDVIIPIKLDAFSLAGMTNVLRQVKNMQKINCKLRVAGILPTMWYKSDTIAEAEKILKNSRLHVFPHIRRSPKADDTTFTRDLAGASAAHLRDYKTFSAVYAEQGGVRK